MQGTSNDYETHLKITNIIDYLHTPRQIKKWLISLKFYYPIIKHSPNKLNFIAFLATIIKHPILAENFSKHTLKILVPFGGELFIPLINENYKIDFTNYKGDKNDIVLASMGITCDDNKDLDIKKLSEYVTNSPISDRKTAEFIRLFLSTPTYLIDLFFGGYADEIQVSAYGDFFDGHIDNTLKALIKSGSIADSLASSLSESLRNISTLTGKPSMKLLNQLWENKVGESFSGDFYNPYLKVILFALSNCTVEQTIAEVNLSLSENFILRILSFFGINNENGKYDIGKFNKSHDSNIEKHFVNSHITFKKTKLADFDKQNIKAILKLWITQVENTLSDNKSEWFKQNNLISVFYRYIQFSEACDLDNDNRKNLSKLLVGYFKDQEASNSDSKKRIIELITKACDEYQNQHFDTKNETPLKTLFNNNADLIASIKDFSRNINVDYIQSFYKLVE